MAKADSADDEVVDKSNLDVDDESQDETEEVDNTDTEDTDEETDETNDDSDQDSDDDSDQDESDDDSDEDSDDTSFKKRYTQLKGDNPEEYITSLETAYKESSTEAIRLNHELQAEKQKTDKFAAIIAKNPDLAEKLGEDVADVELNPALLHAEEQLQKQMKTEYQEFMDGHPDLESDQALQKEMLSQMTIYADTVRRTQRRQPSMKESLRFAWSSLGHEDSKDEALRMKAKSTAARGKSAKTTVKKKIAKQDFTDKQIEVGIQMGIGKTKEEVVKKFRQQLK